MPGAVASIPSPVGGWDAYHSLDNMPPTAAAQMDNFFPQTSSVQLRRGYVEFCATGSTSSVQTLMEYNGGNTSKLLAAAGGHIYDVSSGTATSLGSGYSSDVWSHTNYASGGGTFLLAANASGSDAPIVYDGSTIANVVVTGVTAADLSQVHVFAQRTFYVQRNTLSVWYATAGAYQGALTQFDFGPLCTRGGSIAAVTSWTRDNGFGGADDLFVVVTTKGEILLYNGTNPGDAAAWSMTGRFVVGEPVSGPRCITKVGPDCMLICADGYQPLSEYLTLGESKAGSTNLGQMIGNAASDAVRSYKNNAGWGALLYPEGTQLIINVPISSTRAYQHVVNTTTGAWCRYTNLNAYCWARFNGSPYFGGASGKVYRWDTGTSDNGADIVGEIVTAFSYIGGRGRQKRFTMLRPVIQSTGSIVYSLGMEVDFSISTNLPVVSSNYPAGGIWGSGVWGVSTWGVSTPLLQRRWSGVSGIGFAAAAHIKVSTQTLGVTVNSFDVMYEPGGPL